MKAFIYFFEAVPRVECSLLHGAQTEAASAFSILLYMIS